jgi:hypothetical protein
MTVDLILSEVTYKHVVVCGMTVPRPPTVSPSQWLAFWEQRMRGGKDGHGQSMPLWPVKG